MLRTLRNVVATITVIYSLHYFRSRVVDLNSLRNATTKIDPMGEARVSVFFIRGSQGT